MTDKMRECSECRKAQPTQSFNWTKDRYGIPYRKVCDNCYDKVQDEIIGWMFDPDDAGESLEEP